MAERSDRVEEEVEVALAWLLGKGDFIVPIPGTKRRVYLEENAGAVGIKLSDDTGFEAIIDHSIRPRTVLGDIYGRSRREDSGVFARPAILPITAAISSMIAVPARKTVTKAMSNAVLA